MRKANHFPKSSRAINKIRKICQEDEIYVLNGMHLVSFFDSALMNASTRKRKE